MTQTDVLEVALRIVRAEDNELAHIMKEYGKLCARCNHPYGSHTHMRTHPSTDCSTCGWKRCPAFIRSTYLSRAWRRWQNRNRAVGT